MIKRIDCVILIMIIFFAFFSCGEYKYPSALVKADSLLDCHQPDSAAVLLKSFAQDTAKADEAVKMYYALLELKQQDKQYIPLRNLMKAQRVVRYFHSHGPEDKLAEALFYTGCTYRDLNDAPSALDYFQRAEEKAEKLKDYRLLEAVSGEKGTLFMSQGLYQESAEAYKQYYQYVVLLKDNRVLPTAHMLLARAFEETGKAETALQHYKKAVNAARQLKDKDQIANTAIDLIGALIRLGRYSEVKIYLGHQSDFDMEWGEYYNSINKLDSATFYYQRVLSKDSNLYNRMGAVLSLADINKSKNLHKTCSYLEQYISLDDTLESIRRSKQVKQVQALYNYQQINNDRIEQHKKVKTYSLAFIVVSCIGVAVIVSSLGGYFYYKKKRDYEFVREHLLRLETEKKNQYSIEKLRKNQEKLCLLEVELEKAKQEQDKRRVEKLAFEAQSLKAETINIEVQRQKQQQLEKELFSSLIYIELRERIDLKHYYLSAEEWAQLETIINKTYDNFLKRLSHIVRLNITERRICFLLKIQISPSIIAQLISRTKATVSLSRRRLYEKITGKEGSPQDLDEFIRHF